MVSEAQHQGPVLWPKDILKEHLQVVLVLLGEMILAAAGIDNQSESERHVGTSGEESNLLRNCVLENLEIVLGQALHQCSTGIPYREGHTDKVDLDADGLLRKTGDSGEQRRQHSELSHSGYGVSHLHRQDVATALSVRSDAARPRSLPATGQIRSGSGRFATSCCR